MNAIIRNHHLHRYKEVKVQVLYKWSRYKHTFLRMESRVSLLKEAFSKWLVDFAGRHEEISDAKPR